MSFGLALLVHLNDLLHQAVSANVLVVHGGPADTGHILQQLAGIHESGIDVIQIDLSHIPVDDHLGVSPHSGQEQLHLAHGGVLSLVQDDHAVIERATSHVRQRRDLDRFFLQIRLELAGLQEVPEGVVERSEVRIQLLPEIPRQEAQILSCGHYGATQDDLGHLLQLQHLGSHVNGEVGLPGTRRPYAKRHLVVVYGLKISPLVVRLRSDYV